MVSTSVEASEGDEASVVLLLRWRTLPGNCPAIERLTPESWINWTPATSLTRDKPATRASQGLRSLRRTF